MTWQRQEWREFLLCFPLTVLSLGLIAVFHWLTDYGLLLLLYSWCVVCFMAFYYRSLVRMANIAREVDGDLPEVWYSILLGPLMATLTISFLFFGVALIFGAWGFLMRLWPY